MVRCSFCNAEFRPLSNEKIVTCPYCGTTLTLQGEIVKQHYMLEVSYSEQEARNILFEWTSKQLGAPSNLATESQITYTQLVYYPFWVTKHEANTSFFGYDTDYRFSDPHPWIKGFYKIEKSMKEESGSVARHYQLTVIATQQVPKALKNYEIPLRRKELFDMQVAKQHNGIILDSILSESQAETIAHKRALDMQTVHIRKEVEEIKTRDDKISTKGIFYVHVPVYVFKYKYGFRKYNAWVDASTGHVIQAEYPRSLPFRTLSLLLGLVFLGVGGGSCFAFSYFLAHLSQYNIPETSILHVLGAMTFATFFAFVGFSMLGIYSIYKALSFHPVQEASM